MVSTPKSFSRRRFLLTSATVSAASAVAVAATHHSADAAPTEPNVGVPSAFGLKKFRDHLETPPVLQVKGDKPVRISAAPVRHRYHTDLPETTGWGYEGSLPGPTIEVQSKQRANIDWANDLGTNEHPAEIQFDVVRVPPLPAAISAIDGDSDLKTALSPGGYSTEQGKGPNAFVPMPGSKDYRPYTVTHVHGAKVDGHSDGWAHNVIAPGDYSRNTYPNLSPASTLWYHDHAMAISRYNVFSGMAGFYLIRDETERKLNLPSGDRELPLLLADRQLETKAGSAPTSYDYTGRLLYKQAGYDEDAFYKRPAHGADPDQVGAVPFWGPFNTVNGKIWPTKKVEAAWYRLRLVNASNLLAYSISLHDTTDEKVPVGANILPDDPRFGAHRLKDAMVLIGTDSGFLPKPVRPKGGVLGLAPGERVDILVNFAQLKGRTIELRNESLSAISAAPGKIDASIMQFVVDDAPAQDGFTLPAVLDPSFRTYRHLKDGRLKIGSDQYVPHHEHVWVAMLPIGTDNNSQHPSMWELGMVDDNEPDSAEMFVVKGPGEKPVRLRPMAKLFDDATTITIPEGSWAVWNILHLGGSPHPFHIHMTDFQMINRFGLPINASGYGKTYKDGALFGPVQGLNTSGVSHLTAKEGRPILPEERGRKDTYNMVPGDWIQLLGEFNGARGSFMYHCHILDHEDAMMMRPFVVAPPALMTKDMGMGKMNKTMGMGGMTKGR